MTMFMFLLCHMIKDCICAIIEFYVHEEFHIYIRIMKDYEYFVALLLGFVL